jgi:hypothetical protein
MADNAERQREINRETWAALQDAGAAVGQTLEVDAFFFAGDEPSAGALAGDLTSSGWRVDVQSSKRGVIKKRTLWAVQGTKPVSATDVGVFDQMVDDLDGLAQRHGAEFDGWGAEVRASGERHIATERELVARQGLGRSPVWSFARP